MEFRIWSFEHNGWWKSNWHGYTNDIKQAGIYSLKSALDICKGANIHRDKPNEAIVPMNI